MGIADPHGPGRSRETETLGLLLAGVACISGTLWNGVIYYSDTGTTFLPLVQKVSTGLWVAWLLTLCVSRHPRRRRIA